MIRESASFIKVSLFADNEDSARYAEERVASKIDRVEKEFILTAAAHSGLSLRLHSAGRTQKAQLEGCEHGILRLLPPQGQGSVFRAGEKLSVLFEFRGQCLAFGSEVRRAIPGRLELHWPLHMYRSLSRSWPRVAAPVGFSAELLIPGSELKLGCPECLEYSELSKPELPEARDSLALLVEDFKTRAGELASVGRVIMFKEGRGPSDPAEEMAARLGKALFFPSTLSGLPISDPYPEGRIITTSLAEDFEGPTSLAGNSPLSAFIARRSLEGLNAALWCPIVYYRYAIGLVCLENRADRPRSLDFSAVDYAWDFARSLAWSLKSNAYFPQSQEAAAPSSGEILDASPTGLLIGLPEGEPPLRPGSRIGIRILHGAERHACRALVARRIDLGRRSSYGLALEGLEGRSVEALAQGLYGSSDILESACGA